MDDDVGIEWVNEVADNFEVIGDHLQLFRVFENLGRNAIEAMPEGGRVRLAATRQDAAVAIDVVDNGPASPPARAKNCSNPSPARVGPAGRDSASRSRARPCVSMAATSP